MLTKKGNPEGRMRVLEHLGELRSRIIRTLIAIALTGVAGWILYPLIIDLSCNPIATLWIEIARFVLMNH